MPSLSQFLSIEKLLKNVLQLRMGRSPLTALYDDTTKREKTIDKKVDCKKSKITKRSHAYKGYASSDNVYILNSFNSELQLKNI